MFGRGVKVGVVADLNGLVAHGVEDHHQELLFVSKKSGLLGGQSFEVLRRLAPVVDREIIRTGLAECLADGRAPPAALEGGEDAIGQVVVIL